MTINWKVRLRNPVVWVTIIPVLATFAYTIFGCIGIVPSIGEDKLVSGLLSIVSALSTIGILVDPTTKGVNDSERALAYSKPQ